MISCECVPNQSDHDRYGLCGHPSLHIRPHQTRNSLGWRHLRRCSYPPPLPLPSDNPRPLPPTIVVELLWGEPRLEAFSTGACVAGSVSLGQSCCP